MRHDFNEIDLTRLWVLSPEQRKAVFKKPHDSSQSSSWLFWFVATMAALCSLILL